jgi:hypothetical protein
MLGASTPDQEAPDMRQGPSRLARFLILGAAILATSLLAVAAYGAIATHDRLAATAITSVTFSGSPAKPIITVAGRGLSVPSPSPKVSPSNQTLCPKAITGNAGFDYGTALYVSAFANDQHLYSAGRYRPSLNELDCIGLIILSHTPKKLRFTFGAAYRQADFGYKPLTNGSLVEVVNRNAAFGVVVHYGR